MDISKKERERQRRLAYLVAVRASVIISGAKRQQ